MAGNSFGQIFRITTFGESHGPGIGVVIDGCPPNIVLDESAIQSALDRRRPGQSALTTQRKESDRFQFLSGIHDGKTTGAPIAIWIENKDQKSSDYDHLKESYRPSHADFTYRAKYGTHDIRGGGRSSARETASRVAAGAVAGGLLGENNIEIVAFVSQVGDVTLTGVDESWTQSDVDAYPTRCPDPEISSKMEAEIEAARDDGDTVGGVITCMIKNVPAGLGAPVFDKLHADLAKGMLSINACKGFEIGSGFAAAAMRGSIHNDIFYTNEKGEVRTKTNNSGGIQGGISNGMEIVFRVAFKPVSTLMKEQQSVDTSGNPITIEGKGRHDPCVVPRAVPIVEAMAAIVLADHLLRAKAIKTKS